MYLRTLASGSDGNCILVSCGDTSILIDAGISCRKIVTRLQLAGISPETLGGIFLTHEHCDHIAGLGVFLKRFPLPVYATGGTTRAAVRKFPQLEPYITVFAPGETLTAGALTLRSFATPHDAAESVGYRCDADGRSLAVLTDLGYVSQDVIRAACGVNLALVEANHDEDWLRTGRYAPALKARILSDRGHLSNEAGGAFCAYLAENGAQTLILAHLSAENNSPEHAYQVVSALLAQKGLHPTLEVAPRDELSRTFFL